MKRIGLVDGVEKVKLEDILYDRLKGVLKDILEDKPKDLLEDKFQGLLKGNLFSSSQAIRIIQYLCACCLMCSAPPHSWKISSSSDKYYVLRGDVAVDHTHSKSAS